MANLLTFMATPQTLCEKEKLFKLDVPLSPGENVERVIYLSQRIIDWFKTVPEMSTSIMGLEEAPDEQLDALLHDYITGAPLSYDKRFKKLNPRSQDVWELKTADLRIFGWFYRRNVFVAVAGEEKRRLQDLYGMYAGYVGEVVRFRNDLPLDEPKYLPGALENDVV